MKVGMKVNFKLWREAPARVHSQQVDYGSWWSLNVRPDQILPPFWIVTWVEATRELVAWCHATGRMILLGYYTREDVERILAGWSNPDLADNKNLTALIERLGVYVMGD